LDKDGLTIVCEGFIGPLAFLVPLPLESIFSFLLPPIKLASFDY